MDKGFCISIWKTGPGKRLGQAGGAGPLGCGRGTVCGTIREQRPPGTSGTDGIGGAADSAAAEMQRPVARACLKKRERCAKSTR